MLTVFAGDEFIVFIRDTDDLEIARRTAQEIVTGVSEYVKLPESEQKVSISIGIALYDGHEKNYSEIFKKTDTALYRAKADPANRFCLYEETVKP